MIYGMISEEAESEAPRRLKAAMWCCLFQHHFEPLSARSRVHVPHLQLKLELRLEGFQTAIPQIVGRKV